MFEGSGRSSARVSVDLYRVACPERTYDVYMLSRSCPPEELRTRSRHDCFIIATNEPGVGIECLTGKKRELNPEDPECLQLLLTSPRAREACEIGVRVLNAARGGDLDKRCGSIWGVDHHSAVDGPYYYYDERTLRVVAVCGGACMGGHCKNCPPKEAACGHGPRAPTWQSMRRFYEAEFMAPASPSVDRDQ